MSAVKVRSACRYEPETIGKTGKVSPELGVVLGVPRLDASKTVAGELGEGGGELVAAETKGVRMGDDRQSPGRSRQLDGFSSCEPLAIDVADSALGEIPVERIGNVGGVAAFHENGCDVWPSHHVAACPLGDVLVRDVDADLSQRSEDSAVAVVPRSAQSLERVLERPPARLEEIHEHVHRSGWPLDRQLGAGDEAHPVECSGLPSLGDAIESVMVGQRQCGEAGSGRQLYHVRRWIGPVRSIGVKVEIYCHEGRESGVRSGWHRH